MSEAATLQLAGVFGMLGAALYAVGDVLLLAPGVGTVGDRRPFPIDTGNDRILRRRVTLLADLARLPYWRLRWGALLGVIGAPLTVGGLWLFYRGILPAGPGLAVPPTLLFLYAAITGPFVHGSFAYVGETAQALYTADERGRPMFADMVRRQVATIMIAYAPLMLAVIAASAWASYVILTGQTRFPVWMAGVTPLTMTIAWLLLKAILPKRINDYTQGAGFNIAYLAWFAAMTGAIA
jgi:hypothetical protein